MSIAFVFPGQGSQAVGMGKALADAFPAAKAVFDEADAALGDKLSTLMWEGPTDTLMLTENAQPALLTMSVAVLKVLQAEAGIDLKKDVAFVAGHSLGEYSALTAADVMAEALSKIAVNAPVVPLIANVVAGPIADPAEIKKRLVEQVTGTVRWRECVSYMAGQGVTTFYELGAGKVLSGLVKRIADGATGTAIGSPADVETFKATRG